MFIRSLLLPSQHCPQIVALQVVPQLLKDDLEVEEEEAIEEQLEEQQFVESVEMATEVI